MNRPPNNNSLLDEIFEDDDVQAYKEALLNNCLQRLRPQRRYRVRICTVVGAAAVLLVGVLCFTQAPLTPSHPSDTTPAYLIKAGTGIDPAFYLKSDPSVLDGKLIRSRPELAYKVTPQPLAASLFITEPMPIHHISDSELLALFPGTSCGLIRPEDGPAQFVFFDPDAEKQYFQ